MRTTLPDPPVTLSCDAGDHTECSGRVYTGRGVVKYRPCSCECHREAEAA